MSSDPLAIDATCVPYRFVFHFTFTSYWFVALP